MVRLAARDLERAIELLEQRDAGELVREGHARQRQTLARGVAYALVQPRAPADGERHVAHAADGEVVAALTSDTPTLDRAIWEHVQRVFHDCKGNRSEAARRLRIDRGTLNRWLNRPTPT